MSIAALALVLVFQIADLHAERTCPPEVVSDVKQYDFGPNVEKSRTLKFPSDLEGSVTVDSVNTSDHTLNIKGHTFLEVGELPPAGQEKEYCKFGASVDLKPNDPNHCVYLPVGGHSAAVVSWEFKKSDKDDPHVLVSVLGLKHKHPKGADGKELNCTSDLSIFPLLKKMGVTAAQ